MRERSKASSQPFPERAVVLDRGRIAYDGASQRLRDDPETLARLVAVQ